MPLLVVGEAAIECTFGAAPGTLTVLPEARPLATSIPVATIFDIAPEVNISSFGECSSLTNPTVAAATAAAEGVLTPMPCVPVVVDPWMPGLEKVLINGLPALGQNSKCLCAWEGEISIVEAGQEVAKSG